MSGGGLRSTLSGRSQGPTLSGGSLKQCQGIEPILSQRSLGPILKGRILRLSLAGRSLEPTWKIGIKSSRCQRGAQGPPYQEESRASLSESSLAGWSLRLILYKRSLQGPPCQGHKRKELRSQDHRGTARVLRVRKKIQVVSDCSAPPRKAS